MPSSLSVVRTSWTDRTSTALMPTARAPAVFSGGSAKNRIYLVCKPARLATVANAAGSGLRRPRSDETNTDWKTDSSLVKRVLHSRWWVGLELVNAYSG